MTLRPGNVASAGRADRGADGVAVLLLPLLTLLSPPVPGQEAADDVRGRVEALERRNTELEERLRGLEAGAEETTELALDAALLDGDEGTRLFFQLFADYGASLARPRLDGGGETAFHFGSLGLFTTAAIDDHWGALAEVLIEGEEDELHLDAERLFVRWQASDDLYAKLGLEHLPTTRWNRLYHHGKLLELTIERPYLARFEDDGGVLPMHASGVEVGGAVAAMAGRFEWSAMLSNGRGRQPEDRQRLADDNGAKALDLAASFAPEATTGLIVGASMRRDAFPSDPANGRARAEEALAGGVFVEWARGPLQLLTEGATLLHRVRDGAAFHHRVAYLQAGYSLGEWTPYARVDWKAMERGDPYYAPEELDLDCVEATLGVRRELGEHAACKLELRRGRFAERGAGADTSRRDVTTLAFQLCWRLDGGGT